MSTSVITSIPASVITSILTSKMAAEQEQELPQVCKVQCRYSKKWYDKDSTDITKRTVIFYDTKRKQEVECKVYFQFSKLDKFCEEFAYIYEKGAYRFYHKRTFVVEIEGGDFVLKKHMDNGEYKRCSICGKYTKQYIERNNKILGYGCLEEDKDYFRCANCGAWFRYDECEPNSTHDGEVCEDCFEKYEKCEECGEYFYIDDMTQTSYEYLVCDECLSDNYIRCEDCGEWVKSKDSYYTNSGNRICESCYDDDYFTCERCGGVFHTDNCYHLNDEYLCESCYDECRDASHIHSYHDDENYPNLFHTDSDIEKKKLYLGFELEAGDAASSDAEEFVSVAIDDFSDNETLFHFEEDCTIPDYGAELISSPMTLAYHKNMHWEKIFDMARNKYELKSYDASSSCGLHVHTSKNYLSKYEWCFVKWFVTWNQEEFKTIARRDNHYCLYDDIDNRKCNEIHKNLVCKNINDNNHFYSKYSKDYNGHYSAVRMYTGKPTVEFRLFKGTLLYSSVIASIEICDSLIKWVKSLGAAGRYYVMSHRNNRDEIMNKWYAWAESHEEYKEMIDYLKNVVSVY